MSNRLGLPDQFASRGFATPRRQPPRRVGFGTWALAVQLRLKPLGAPDIRYYLPMATPLPELLEGFKRELRWGISGAKNDHLPPSLFHYTTGFGFHGILSTNVIRATNFSFLNDPTEITYGRDIIQALLLSTIDKLRPSAEADFLSLTASVFRNRAVNEVYVSCFTGLQDDLSQWRSYGTAASARYSIGFASQALYALRMQNATVRLERVIYQNKDQAGLVNSIVERSRRFVKERKVISDDMHSLAEIAANQLARLVPRLKSPAYVAENEWRIVITPSRDDLSEVEFDASRGFLRPYIRVPLVPDSVSNVHIMAPFRGEAALKATQLLLRKTGSRAVARLSLIPFAE